MKVKLEHEVSPKTLIKAAAALAVAAIAYVTYATVNAFVEDYQLTKIELHDFEDQVNGKPKFRIKMASELSPVPPDYYQKHLATK